MHPIMLRYQLYFIQKQRLLAALRLLSRNTCYNLMHSVELILLLDSNKAS